MRIYSRGAALAVYTRRMRMHGERKKSSNLFRKIATRVRIYVYTPTINMTIRADYTAAGNYSESGVPDLFVSCTVRATESNSTESLSCAGVPIPNCSRNSSLRRANSCRSVPSFLPSFSPVCRGFSDVGPRRGRIFTRLKKIF